MKRSSLSRYVYLCLSIALLFISFAIYSCTKELKIGTSPQSDRTSEPALLSLSASVGVDTSALVAWYDFNGGSLSDRSSYHNNIALNNATLAADRHGVAGNAYYFSGNNYMRVANSASLNTDKGITLFAIIKVSDFYEGKCHGNSILHKGYNDQQSGVYYMTFVDGYYEHNMNCSEDVDKDYENFSAAYGNFNTGYYNAEGDSVSFVQTDRWYHLVYTYANGVGSYYIDGKLTQSGAGPVGFKANGDDLYIGALDQNNPQYPYYFTGTIDQIGIFNKALNAQQVARLSTY